MEPLIVFCLQTGCRGGDSELLLLLNCWKTFFSYIRVSGAFSRNDREMFAQMVMLFLLSSVFVADANPIGELDFIQN